MKLIATTLVVALAVQLSSCNSTHYDQDYSGTRKMWVGEAIHGASIDNAIVRQRTLYAYHFHSGSAQLNELGERDLQVLAEHFIEFGGAQMSVRRGGASAELYQARVDAVSEYLLTAGLLAEALSIGDGTPGGDGFSSPNVLAALEGEMSETADEGYFNSDDD